MPLRTRRPPHDVGETGGEAALPVAVRRLGSLKPPQQRAEQYREQRHAQQHHRGEKWRYGQQQCGHDDIGEDGADAGPGDRQRIGDHRDVTEPDGDDLAGRGPARQRRAQPGRLGDHHPHRTEGTVEPHSRHRAVPHDGQPGVEHSDTHQCRDPADQRRAAPGLQPVVDGARQQVRRQGQADHPGAAEQGPGANAAPLTGDQPPQIPPGAAEVRGLPVRIRADRLIHGLSHVRTLDRRCGRPTGRPSPAVGLRPGSPARRGGALRTGPSHR